MTAGIGAHNNVRRSNNDFLIDQSHAGFYVNMPAAQTQETVFDDQQQVQAQGSSECEDGQDDGHISLWSKFKNAVKGVGNFFKGMVCDENGNFSLGQTLKTVAIGVGVGALCVLTAGTAVPAIVATAGIAMSGYGLVKAGVQAANAKTDAEAEAAWQSIGSNGTALGLSLWGAKSLAKANAAAGVEGYSGNYNGVTGTLRAVKDVGGHAFSPVKSAWTAARAGYSAGGFSEAASCLKSNAATQWGEFTTTVKGNYNRIAFGTQKNIQEETEALAKREDAIQKQLDKAKDGSTRQQVLQKQLNDVQAQRAAMQEINSCETWESAHSTIDGNKATLQAKQAELARATDPALKADLGKEIAQLEQTIKTQESVLSRRVGEVRALDDRIATLEKKQTNIDWTDKNAGIKFDRYQAELEQLQAQRANGLRLPESPSGFNMKDYNEWTVEYNKLRATVAKGDHVPPTTPEGIAELAKARADLAEIETVYNPMKADYARYQVANGKGSYYGHGASEVGRNIGEQFTILRKQDPTAFRLTISTAGRNDEIEQRFANLLPSEQREQFFRLTAPQRHQIAQQVFAA